MDSPTALSSTRYLTHLDNINYLLRSSPLHKQEVQRRESQHKERTRHDSESRNITPQRQHIESDTAQDRTAGDFDVEAVLLVDK